MDGLLLDKNLDSAVEGILGAATLIRERGWAPATSGNFSQRVADNRIAITVSGADTARLGKKDIIEIDLDGQTSDDRQPSAETKLHLQLYRRDPSIGAVLHTHSMFSALLSEQADQLVFSNLEIIKAFAGHISHEATLTIPVFENTQDMNALAASVEAHMTAHGQGHAYLIQGHGGYTWGTDMPECIRHLEALEFLLEYEWQLKRESG